MSKIDQNSVKNEYIYLDNIPVGVIPRGYLQDGVYYIHTDHLGTPRRLADENGAIVWSWESDPFGESKAVGSVELNLRFAGQYFDNETSTHYNINRDYNPKTGRYIESDPIGFDGGVNSYGYVAGNPLGAVDEMGLFICTTYAKYLGKKANPCACASFIQTCYPAVGHTSKWRKGLKVRGSSIALGTLVATFETDDRYHSRDHANHAAMYYYQDSQAIWVLDSWCSSNKVVSVRPMKFKGLANKVDAKENLPVISNFKDPSNNGDALYVIKH